MSDILLLSDLNPQNIKQFISEAYSVSSGYGPDEYGDLYSEAIYELGSTPIQYGELFISAPVRTGGREGSGEYMDIVWKITDCNDVRYFKETGRYYSFVGGEWNDDMREVFPKQKEITVYE